MNEVYPDEGLSRWLERLAGLSVVYGLWVNNIAVTKTTTIADLVEASWIGYARLNVAAADWKFKGVHLNQGKWVAEPIEFINPNPAGNVVCGYFCVDIFGGAEFLTKVARFDDAPRGLALGQSVYVVPMLGDFSRF